MDMGIAMLEISKKIESDKVSVASGGISKLQKNTDKHHWDRSSHLPAAAKLWTRLGEVLGFNSHPKLSRSFYTKFLQQVSHDLTHLMKATGERKEKRGVLCTMRMWSVVTVLQGLESGGASFSARVSDWHGCKVVNIKWPYFDSAMPDLCFCQTCLTHSRDKQVHARATWFRYSLQ